MDSRRLRRRTLLKLLEALERNLELVLVGEHGGVVDNLDAEKRDDRHDGRFCFVDVRREFWGEGEEK